MHICYVADQDGINVYPGYCMQYNTVLCPSPPRTVAPPSARRGRNTTSDAPGAEGGTRERDETEYKTQ